MQIVEYYSLFSGSSSYNFIVQLRTRTARAVKLANLQNSSVRKRERRKVL